MLASCLDSHPNVICEGEILNTGEWQGIPPAGKIDRLRALERNEAEQWPVYLTSNFYRQRCTKKKPLQFGALIKYEHINLDLMAYLKKQKHIFIVYRKNVLQRELSYALAYAIRERSNRREFIHYQNYTTVEPIRFGVEVV